MLKGTLAEENPENPGPAPGKIPEKISVYVRGRKRPPGKAIPYPLDDNRWEKKLGGGESFQWAWHLRMQTFGVNSL